MNIAFLLAIATVCITGCQCFRSDFDHRESGENVDGSSDWVRRHKACGNFNASLNTCCNGVLANGSGLSCCGRQGYDPSVGTCCFGSLVSGSNLSCCGKLGYSQAIQTCCDGSLVNGSNMACCRHIGYDSAQNTCCRGKLVNGYLAQRIPYTISNWASFCLKLIFITLKSKHVLLW
jgi:hypothetical protein